MSGYRIQVEPLSRDLIARLDDIINRNWAETGGYGGLDLAPDWDSYLNLEVRGMFRCYVVTGPDWAIVGYAFYTVMYHPQSQYTSFAMQEACFVDEQYRKDGVGIQLVKFIEHDLRDGNIELMTQSARPGTPFNKVLERMGYELAENTYLKRL